MIFIDADGDLAHFDVKYFIEPQLRDDRQGGEGRVDQARCRADRDLFYDGPQEAAVAQGAQGKIRARCGMIPATKRAKYIRGHRRKILDHADAALRPTRKRSADR